MTTDLYPWRCGNPACPSKRAGQGQIVMKGRNVPGWAGEGYCHQCHHFTFVEVAEQGELMTMLRPARSQN